MDAMRPHTDSFHHLESRLEAARGGAALKPTKPVCTSLTLVSPSWQWEAQERHYQAQKVAWSRGHVALPLLREDESEVAGVVVRVGGTAFSNLIWLLARLGNVVEMET